jgi:hypothetical protein
MSGPAIVALFLVSSFGLMTLAFGVAHAAEVRAEARNGARK